MRLKVIQVVNIVRSTSGILAKDTIIIIRAWNAGLILAIFNSDHEDHLVGQQPIEITIGVIIFLVNTPDKVIVISGDTRPCENIMKYGKGADILIHEVYCKKGFDEKNEFWQNYHSKNHISTYELGKIANETKPRLIILYHILFWGAKDEDLLREISEVYRGKVVVGRDLGIY